MKIHQTAIIKVKEEFLDEVLEELQNMVSETVKEEACEFTHCIEVLTIKIFLFSMKSGKQRRSRFAQPTALH